MKNLLFTLAAFIIVGGIVAGVIFGLAGRWDLWNIWAYIGLFVVLVTLADYRRSPEMFRADPGRAPRSRNSLGPHMSGYGPWFTSI
jgi:hypothetical protein